MKQALSVHCNVYSHWVACIEHRLQAQAALEVPRGKRRISATSSRARPRVREWRLRAYLPSPRSHDQQPRPLARSPRAASGAAKRHEARWDSTRSPSIGVSHIRVLVLHLPLQHTPFSPCHPHPLSTPPSATCTVTLPPTSGVAWRGVEIPLFHTPGAPPDCSTPADALHKVPCKYAKRPAPIV